MDFGPKLDKKRSKKRCWKSKNGTWRLFFFNLRLVTFDRRAVQQLRRQCAHSRANLLLKILRQPIYLLNYGKIFRCKFIKTIKKSTIFTIWNEFRKQFNVSTGRSRSCGCPRGVCAIPPFLTLRLLPPSSCCYTSRSWYLPNSPFATPRSEHPRPWYEFAATFSLAQSPYDNPRASGLRRRPALERFVPN